MLFEKNTVEKRKPLGEQVMLMRKQKLSDNQIMQSLQNEGYTAQQILDAFDLADQANLILVHPEPITLSNPMEMKPRNIAPESKLNPIVGGQMIDNQRPQFQNNPVTSMQKNNANNIPPFNPNPGMNGMKPQGGVPPIQPFQPNANAPMPMPINDNASEEKSKTDEDIEELIEAIIDEKWAEIEKNVNKVVEWKDSVQDEMNEMKQKVDALQTSFDNLHKAIVGKIGDYDKNILNVGTQLKAMEQVFSKVLPTFTDNVNELSRIADKIKKGNTK